MKILSVFFMFVTIICSADLKKIPSGSPLVFLLNPEFLEGIADFSQKTGFPEMRFSRGKPLETAEISNIRDLMFFVFPSSDPEPSAILVCNFKSAELALESLKKREFDDFSSDGKKFSFTVSSAEKNDTPAKKTPVNGYFENDWCFAEFGVCNRMPEYQKFLSDKEAVSIENDSEFSLHKSRMDTSEAFFYADFRKLSVKSGNSDILGSMSVVSHADTASVTFDAVGKFISGIFEKESTPALIRKLIVSSDISVSPDRKHIPAEAVTFLTVKISPENYSVKKETADYIQKDFGLSLEKDVLPMLGNQLTLMLFPPEAGFPVAGIDVLIKDSSRWENFRNTVLKSLGEKGIVIEQNRISGLRTDVLRVPFFPQVAVSFMLKDGRLKISSTENGLKKMAESSKCISELLNYQQIMPQKPVWLELFHNFGILEKFLPKKISGQIPEESVAKLKSRIDFSIDAFTTSEIRAGLRLNPGE